MTLKDLQKLKVLSVEGGEVLLAPPDWVKQIPQEQVPRMVDQVSREKPDWDSIPETLVALSDLWLYQEVLYRSQLLAIREHPEYLKNPLKVLKHGGRLYLVDGYHRFTVAFYSGIHRLPVKILEVPHENFMKTDDEIMAEAYSQMHGQTPIRESTGTWSTEPPTEPGYYWYKAIEGPYQTPGVAPVWRNNEGMLVGFFAELSSSAAVRKLSWMLWHSVPLTPPPLDQTSNVAAEM